MLPAYILFLIFFSFIFSFDTRPAPFTGRRLSVVLGCFHLFYAVFSWLWFFEYQPSDWLRRASPKWPILCRMPMSWTSVDVICPFISIVHCVRLLGQIFISRCVIHILNLARVGIVYAWVEDGELRRTLQSLACGKARVLSKQPKVTPVSYTHLTLPTILRV